MQVLRLILQRPAEAMARAAGSAIRLFAGTDSLNVGLTASHTATLDPNNPQVHGATCATILPTYLVGQLPHTDTTSSIIVERRTRVV